MHREEIEQFAFLYLCGPRDRRLLSGREKMTFSDFERLIYITAFLGLIHYNLKIWNQYSTQFQKQLEYFNLSCESKSTPFHSSEYEEDIHKQWQWLAEFCGNAPNRSIREYLEKVTNI